MYSGQGGRVNQLPAVQRSAKCMIFSMVLTVKNRVQMGDMWAKPGCGVGGEQAGLQPMGDT